LYGRLESAASLRESTSVILCGPRGSGKHGTVRRVLERLDDETSLPRYDVVHLQGLLHHDANAGLRELARQLSATATTSTTSKYVDDLQILAEELTRRTVERSAPLLVVLSNLEAFASQQRQTLLYTLLDAMQGAKTCLVVVGVSADRNVLEHFEKRVRSRLNNHQIAFGHTLSKETVIEALDDRMTLLLPNKKKRSSSGSGGGGGNNKRTPRENDDEEPLAKNERYAKAHDRAWKRLKKSKAFDATISRGVILHRSLRWYETVAANAVAALAPSSSSSIEEPAADAKKAASVSNNYNKKKKASSSPLLTEGLWLAAVEAQEPTTSRAWVRAVAAMPPPQVALVVAYLRFERDDRSHYNLDAAAAALTQLARVNAAAVAFADAALLRAQAALLSSGVVVLRAAATQVSSALDPTTLRFAHVRLSGAFSLEDLWTALRKDELHCPTSLRQWALQGHQVAPR